MTFCSNCGSEAHSEGQFCPSCGKRTASEVAPSGDLMTAREPEIGVFEPRVHIPIQQPSGVPSLAIPIIFGWAGAWWASNKAAKLGVADTGRYWKAGIISSVSVAVASLLVPFAIISLLGLALFSAETTTAKAALSGISSTAPSAEGIDPGPATAAPGAPAATVDQVKVAALTEKVSVNPKDIVSLQALGDIYFAARDYKTASAWEEKILAIDPKNEKALLSVGAAQFNLGNAPEAKKQWLVAADLYPNNAEVHYDLGFLYMSATPPDSINMQAEWKKVVAIDPNSDLAKTVATQLASSTASPTASATPSAK
jgi:tetratricopeptide (TPR) repeat protein